MVELQNATVRKKGATLLDNITLTLPPAGLTAIAGANGSGKSTLLRLLHGLERLRSGTIIWPAPIAPLEQSFVFQKPIFLRRSVFENLYLPLKLRGVKRADAQAPVMQALNDMELLEKQGTMAQYISGGQQQKLGLAMAMITKPKLLFLDEPTANLDNHATAQIEGQIKSALKGGTRVLLASHSIAQIKRIADDVIYMEQGREMGPMAVGEFLKSPQMDKIKAD